MFRFPFTNLHELNLDWILAEVKKFSELIPPMETAVQDVQEALEDSTSALAIAEEAKHIAEQAAQAVVADGSITTPKLATSAVTTGKIADGSVTTDKLDAYAVTSAKIDTGAVTTNKINDGAVTTNKIADDGVTTAKIADDAVTTGKIADDAVTEIKIVDGAVTWDKLAVSCQTALNRRIIRLTNVPCSALTGDFVSVSNSYIDSSYIVDSVVFADPTVITGSITWTTGLTTLVINGRCRSATTCDIILLQVKTLP